MSNGKAVERWKILFQTLQNPVSNGPDNVKHKGSTRRISSFNLFTHQRIAINPENICGNCPEICGNCPEICRNCPEICGNCPKICGNCPKTCGKIATRQWYKYTTKPSGKFKVNTLENCAVNNAHVSEYSIIIAHTTKRYKIKDILGMNNTGNICIWPSEEVLAYYVLENLQCFHGKTVIELGGGLSCLAGLICGKYASAKRVTLTDGNEECMENVVATVKCNALNSKVDCKVLKWNYTLSKTTEKYDVILCADCLYFDESRGDLVEAIWKLLDEGGLCLVMAPKRGKSFGLFLNLAMRHGFFCEVVTKYSELVWQRHEGLLKRDDYDPDIHYPILLKLTKYKV